MIRAINGKRSKNPVLHLKKKDGTTAETEEEIVETLADHFEQQSSSAKHCEHFRSTKQQAEKTKLNFNSDNRENYNRVFSMKDLKKSIKKAKNSSEGGDMIHYEIIKHLPYSSLEIFLKSLIRSCSMAPFRTSGDSQLLFLFQNQTKIIQFLLVTVPSLLRVVFAKPWKEWLIHD